MERAEDTARLILERHQSILDLPRAIQPGWEPMLEVLSAQEGFAQLKKATTEDNVIRYVFGDRSNSSSLISSLAAARENMRTTREVLPSEAWEQINSLYLSVARRSSKGLPRGSRHAALNNIIKACQQNSGMLSGNMSHNAAYQFLQMGRMLERADMTTRIIDVGTADLMTDNEEHLPYKNVQWTSLLESLSAYQMYRVSVRSKVNPSDVVNFLLRDEDFPRALVHCLLKLESSMQLLPGNGPALKIVAKVLRKVKRSGSKAARNALMGDALHDFLDDMQRQLTSIHQVIDDTWFSPGR